jgi:hypothetical protein
MAILKIAGKQIEEIVFGLLLTKFTGVLEIFAKESQKNLVKNMKTSISRQEMFF